MIYISFVVFIDLSLVFPLENLRAAVLGRARDIHLRCYDWI